MRSELLFVDVFADPRDKNSCCFAVWKMELEVGASGPIFIYILSTTIFTMPTPCHVTALSTRPALRDGQAES